MSPDGTRIAIGYSHCHLHIHDGETYELLANFQGHRRGVRKVRFSPSGKKLASASTTRR